MKRLFNIFPYVLLLLLWVFSCTKDVSLITEVEFELIENHEQEGYINQPLATTVTVVPEVEMEDYTYSFTYSTLEGVGHFENLEGKAYSLTEKIPFNPLSSSVAYKGTEKGTHTIKIEAQDNYGLQEEIQITYTIIDVPVLWTATSPVSEIELGKSAPIAVTLATDVEDTDVTYEFNYLITQNSVTFEETLEDFSPITPATVDLRITPLELGPFAIEFYLRDSNDQELTAAISFEVVEDVVDTTAPEITLLGDNPFQIFLGSTYTDPGATALDDIDGNITENITIDTAAINTDQEGSFEIAYSVSDDDGNTANAVRTVNVVRDPNGNQPPVAVNDTANTEIGQAISILALQNDTDSDTPIAELSIVELGAVQPADAGTAEFNGQTITFTPSSNFEGDATFTYTINDGNVGNNAQASVTVSVSTAPDTEKPVITLNGGNVSLTVGQSYDEQGATAIDNVDGNITANIAIDGTAVDIENPGTYQVTYNVSDAAGNAADQRIRSVTVGGGITTDTIPPTITLVGGDVTLVIGQPYEEQGATANDDIDGDVTANITIDETAVVIGTPGAYEITYNVSDTAGNPAIEVVRTLTIETGTTNNQPPVANTDSYTIEIDHGPFIVPVLENDTDPDTPLDELRIIAVGELQPAESGALVFDENAQTITYAPAQGYEGLAAFAYIINDGNVGNDAASGASIIIGLGDARVTEINISPSNLSLEPGNSGALIATLTPTNPGPQNVSWSSDNPEVATVNANGTVTAVAAGNATVTASHTNSANEVLSATSEITIIGANQPPVAVDDAANVVQGETVGIQVLANDSDPDTPMNQVSITAVGAVQPPGAGSVTLNDRQVDFTAAADFEGSATFAYSIWDNIPNNDATAHVTVDVQATTAVLISAITVAGPNIVQDDDTAQFTAVTTPANATNQNLVWSSSDASIATVAPNTGIVSGVAEGTVTIMATALDGSGISGSASLLVTPSSSGILVNSITVTRNRSSIMDNETEQFTAVISPTDATNQNVSWTSDNTDVATVNANNGLVTAVAEGVANITATATDGSGTIGSATITVNTPNLDVPVSGITVTRNRSSIADNETEQFTAAISPTDATNQNVSWTSDNTNVATVDTTTGLVTAVAEGVANITATAADGSGTTGSATITIASNEVLVTGITMAGPYIIQDDDIAQFTALIAPANATNQNLVWSSNNTSFATVTPDTGIVSGVSQGVVTITATASDGSGIFASQIVSIASTTSNILVNSITVSTDSGNLAMGESTNFFATVLPDDATNKTVEWSSDAPSIASVDPSTGVVTGISEGTATITAAATDGSDVNGWYSIKINPPLSAENDILFVKYGQISGSPITNSDNHTVDIKVFTGTDRMVGPEFIEISEFASIDPPGDIDRNFYYPVTYTVTAQNGDPQVWTVTITEDTNNTKEITKFTINDIDGDIKGTDITVTLPAGVDRSTLTPIIEHTGISVYPDSGSQQDLRYQKQYIVKSIDGSEVIYTIRVVNE